MADTIKPYNMSDNNKFKTIVVFDCRGLEPVEFSPRNGWKVLGWKSSEDDDDDSEAGYSRDSPEFFEIALISSVCS